MVELLSSSPCLVICLRQTKFYMSVKGLIPESLMISPQKSRRKSNDLAVLYNHIKQYNFSSL